MTPMPSCSTAAPEVATVLRVAFDRPATTFDLALRVAQPTTRGSAVVGSLALVLSVPLSNDNQQLGALEAPPTRARS